MSESKEPQDELRDDEQPQMTPEEYVQAREKAMQHLKKEIVLLKVEKEYENLVADVEEAKTRRITMIAQRARFYAQDNPEPQAQPGSDSDIDKVPSSQPKRKLKTEA